MKKTLIYTVITAITALFISCAPTTQITGSWKNPQQAENNYKSIMVAALTSNTVLKSRIENDIAAALSNTNMNVLKSIDEFPPSVTRDSTDKKTMISKMRQKNVDAILTIALLKKETESRYIPGNNYLYAPAYRFGYYDNFWGYYNYWYPMAYDPGYYTQSNAYYYETNLYDANTEKLVWSAQTRTYSSSDAQSFSKNFSTVIVSRLKGDRVLR